MRARTDDADADQVGTGRGAQVGALIKNAEALEVLARLVSVHGATRHLRSDNGPEFVSRAIRQWVDAEGIDTAFIDPGKPWQNGADESFNGRFRDECLSMEWFRNRTEAVAVIAAWRDHYNSVRPHSSLGYLTPEAFKAKQAPTNSTSGGATS